MRKIQIAVTCYRYIATPSIIITFIISWQLWISHSMGFLVFAIWSKAITAGLLMLYVYIFRSGQFYFFNNLGFSNAYIFSAMALVDLLIAFISLLISVQFI